MDAGGPQVLDIDMRTTFGRLKGKMGVPPAPIRLAELAYNFLATTPADHCSAPGEKRVRTVPLAAAMFHFLSDPDGAG